MIRPTTYHWPSFSSIVMAARASGTIESLTVRLLAGQNSEGGWTYTLSDGAGRMLRLQQSMLQTGDLPRDPKKRTPQDLPAELTDQLKQIGVTPPFGGALAGRRQLQHPICHPGTMGRALARLLPVEQAAGQARAAYFRLSQSNVDGGWGYTGTNGDERKQRHDDVRRPPCPGRGLWLRAWKKKNAGNGINERSPANNLPICFRIGQFVSG